MSDVTCNLDFNSSTDIAICNENMEASVPLKEYSNFDLNSKDLNDLPTLVIEIILSHFTYYQILQLRLISPYWDFVVIGKFAYSFCLSIQILIFCFSEYLNKANRSFVNNLSKYRVQWVSVKEQIEDFNQFPESGEFSQRKKTRSIPKMSPRYYHSACYTNNYMYVFGGCISPSTAYNDLWRFNVTTKKWHRIIAEGSLPLPRLFSSFTHYEFKDDNDVVQHYIVLFGGLLFDEKLDIKDRLLSSIHFFDISKNRWSLIQIQNDMHLKSCQHSAVVIENELIILNGFRMIKNEEIDRSKVFVFDLKKHFWRLQNMKFNKTNMDPPLRQTLVKRKVIPSPFVLDKHNILSMCDNTMSLNKKLTLHPMMYIAPYILKRSHCNDVLCEQCKSKREQLSEDATWEMTQVDISKTDVDMELIFSGEFCKVHSMISNYPFLNSFFQLGWKFSSLFHCEAYS